LGTTRLRGRSRSRWEDEAREDGRVVGGEGWQEKLYNGELLRTARNRRILHMAMEWMNECCNVAINCHFYSSHYISCKTYNSEFAVFHSCRTMALGSTQPLTEVSTRDIF
jgi:hypothetical protein